jgi:UMF1 family MFS transporter
VQTIIYLATAFASKILGFETKELIVIILILQIIAIPGAYLFAYIAKLSGNKLSISIMLVIWILICLFAFFLDTKPAFYLLAACVGLVLGGIQSMSRSTYTKLLDTNEKDITCYYSFYDVLFKLSVVFGTALFAILEIVTDNMRYSILGLMVLFMIGLVIFRGVKIEQTPLKINELS